MKNKVLAGMAVMLLIGALALVGVSAYKGNPDVTGPNYNEAVHTQLEAAMDAGDYDAWLKVRQDNGLPTKGRIFQAINEENFGKYVEMHDAQLAGDSERADEIRTELGLGQGKQMGNQAKGTGTAQGSGSMQSNRGSQRQGIGGSRQGTCDFIDANNDGICDNHQ
ncbi:MAG: hypothetical protein V1866_06095 [archaeon]